ncbi:hypothetical protein [Mesorhizobium sp. B2-3-10]|uniref:hypothetical protein n=1 Tax=Mesorhizobium sp. B2-3-10 TaxID=2589954 RepID=UPI00112B279C|nr:hypothetical protein [Mesorhizobium sp. B2-3-10]TPL98314.1 hypothetical protein FJ943_15530 [Mesorhizobium sp. B2-3-10]
MPTAPRFTNKNESLGLPADATKEQIAAAKAKQKQENEAAAAADAEAARVAAQTGEQQAIAAEDELYAKALNERADLTLVPLSKIEGNHTVKRVGDKVYPGNMVIAERL